MMKIVALLVLIVLATPAFAQDFQEFLKMFTDPGMQGNPITSCQTCIATSRCVINA
uniref:U18-Nephitoxin-Nsp1z_1 n=1 Tax=Nephila sp. SGP-2016 TaxID=1905176 RepID=A0A4Q8K230_9ARAC